MKIRNYDKVLNNAEKFAEDSNSNKVFFHSLKILIPNKKNYLRKLVFVIIEVLIAYSMAKRYNTIELTEDVIQVVIVVVLALLAIVFTGYAFFQALINDELLVSMIEVGGNGNNKLYETNGYFAEVMIFKICCILLDLLAIVCMIALPEYWMLFRDNMKNELLASIIISFVLYCNVESIWEMKSFIYNVFQLFNLHAYSRVVEIKKKKHNNQSK